MKTKIQIKSIWGNILFEYEKENNTVKDTLINAVLSRTDLSGADLREADLTGAYLRGADLSVAKFRGADLRGTDLSGADLSGADLRGAYLRGAYLRGADLTGAYLRGADLRGTSDEIIKIQKIAFFSGLYEYDAASIIDQDGVKWIKLGCFTRKLTNWEKDFWNNDQEFPNNNREKSKLRKFAFQTCKNWFKIVD